jgi:hypothetical protein
MVSAFDYAWFQFRRYWESDRAPPSSPVDCHGPRT